MPIRAMHIKPNQQESKLEESQTRDGLAAPSGMLHFGTCNRCLEIEM